MKRKHIYLLILGLFAGLASSAQTNEEAEKWYTLAKRQFLRKAVDSAFISYGKALDLEQQQNEASKAFEARCYLGLARCERKGGLNDKSKYAESNKYYQMAFGKASLSGELALSKEVLHNWSDLYFSIKLKDAYLNPQLDTQQTKNVFFSLKRITKTEDEYILAEVYAGLNQGVYLGSTGGVLTAYSKKYKNRGNEVIGNCEVVEIYNNKCVIRFKPNLKAKKKNLNLMAGDNVQLKCYEHKGVYKGLIYDIAVLNTYFNISRYRSHYNTLVVSNLRTKYQEEMLIRVLLDQVHVTAKGLLKSDSNELVLTKPLNNQRFGNRNLLNCMDVSTLDDAKAFLRFVASFPAKYMGRNFKFDETYATWVLNDLVPASDGAKYLRKDLETVNDLKAWYSGNKTYLREDTTLMATWVDHLNSLIKAEEYSKAFSLASKMMYVAKAMNNKAHMASMAYQLGLIRFGEQKLQEAILYFDQAIQYDSTHANAFWDRGNIYSELENIKKAIADHKKVLEYYPYFASAHGSIGWMLFEAGKFKKAAPYIEEAHKLDSFEPAWIINYGHLKVMLESGENAMYYYKRALSLMRTEESYKKGIIADFDLFAENGWKEDLFNKLRKEVENEWEIHYRFKTRANQSMDLGYAAYKNNNFDEALDYYRKSIKQEKKGRDTSFVNLRLSRRWLGYLLYKKQCYEESLDEYKKAWLISKNKLHNPENELADLKSIDDLYSYLDQEMERIMYQELKKAVSRKINLSKKNKNLYLLSIGNQGTPESGFGRAANDAKSISGVIKANAELLFDSLISYEYSSAENNGIEIMESFHKIIASAKPEDVFIFYFAGKAWSGNLYLTDDMLLSAKDLHNFLMQCQAAEQMIILDAPLIDLTSTMMYKSENGGDKNMMIVESGYSRIELPGEENSFMCSQILKALGGEAEASSEGLISAKSVESYLSKQFRNEQLSLQTYFSGVDFNVNRTQVQRKENEDKTAPKIEVYELKFHTATRGGKTQSMDQNNAYIIGKVYDQSGIHKLIIDGVEVKVAKNGKFLLSSFIPESNDRVQITCIDNLGNKANQSFEISNENQATLEPQSANRGTNYALLFGTNTYEHNSWDDLRNPINDVEAIGRLLETYYGFNVQIVKNASKREMQNWIYTYMRKEYKENDQLFVFVAGHGMYDPKLGGQIVCKDSRDAEDEIDTYIPYWFLTSNLNSIENCKNVFLGLDVCFGGGFFDRQDVTRYYGSRSYVTKREFIKAKKSKKTRLFLTSGGLEYVPDGAPGGHSPFAQMFIEALESGGGEQQYLTLADISNYMGRLKTQPRYGRFGENESGGDFVFEFMEESYAQRQGQNRQSPN